VGGNSPKNGVAKCCKRTYRQQQQQQQQQQQRCSNIVSKTLQVRLPLLLLFPAVLAEEGEEEVERRTRWRCNGIFSISTRCNNGIIINNTNNDHPMGVVLSPNFDWFGAHSACRPSANASRRAKSRQEVFAQEFVSKLGSLWGGKRNMGGNGVAERREEGNRGDDFEDGSEKERIDVAFRRDRWE
jgi:hypothetical protein